MTSAPDRVILTPEHVEIRLLPAGAGSRYLALILDALFALALAAFAYRLVAGLLPESLGTAVGTTLTFVLSWGYHVYFESRHEGRSPGKRLVGLRVVDGRGLPISLEQSFVRNVVRVLDAAPLFYGVGAFACQIDRHKRRLGDIAADTLVIREGRRVELEGAAWRAREHNSLRVPRVLRLMRHRIGLEEREFLLALTLRAEELEPKARFDLMEEVGAFYRRKLEVDDPRLSGENLVRGLTAALFWDRRSGARGAAPGRER